MRSFLGFSGLERKKVICSWLPFWGHTHTLNVRSPAWFVLPSTHKLMQSFNQINAPFPGFATNFQWNPSSHMAEFPIQPSYIVLHLGRWLVLFQLPLNKWGFNSSFISSKERWSACSSTSVWSGIVQTSHLQAATSSVQKHNMPPAYSRQPDQGQMFLWFYCTFGLAWWAIIRQSGQSAILPSPSLWHSFVIENHLVCFNLKHRSVCVPSQTLNRSIFISN